MIVEKFSSVKELKIQHQSWWFEFFCVILVLKNFKTQVSGDSSNRLVKSENMIENTYHLFDQDRLFKLSTAWRFQYVSSTW